MSIVWINAPYHVLERDETPPTRIIVIGDETEVEVAAEGNSPCPLPALGRPHLGYRRREILPRRLDEGLILQAERSVIPENSPQGRQVRLDEIGVPDRVRGPAKEQEGNFERRLAKHHNLSEPIAALPLRHTRHDRSRPPGASKRLEDRKVRR